MRLGLRLIWFKALGLQDDTIAAMRLRAISENALAREHRRCGAVSAALAYAAVMFGFGMLLGAVRVMAVAPRLGETLAVLLEAPVMLGLSWIACAWCMRRFRVPTASGTRVFVGATAFTLLIAAELCLSLTTLRGSLTDFFSSYLTAAGAIGLAAQLGFACIPFLQARPLAAVRALHTAIYGVMTAATCHLLVSAVLGLHGPLLWISLGLLATESSIFVAFGFKCPLTAVAVRNGAGSDGLFDTFLPERLTRHTFRIFTPLILLGLALLGLRWMAFGGCWRWTGSC